MDKCIFCLAAIIACFVLVSYIVITGWKFLCEKWRLNEEAGRNERAKCFELRMDILRKKMEYDEKGKQKNVLESIEKEIIAQLENQNEKSKNSKK